MNFRKNISDNLSICLSLACILHCIALPLLIIILPTFSSFWINNENVHVILVILAIPISLFAMTKSLTKHHNYKCIFLGLIIIIFVSCLLQTPTRIENATFINNSILQQKFDKQISKLDNMIKRMDNTLSNIN